MAALAYRSSTVHRCTKCAGLWFEPVDHERLKDAAGEIDIGDVAVGAQYNHIDRINCPKCTNWPLIRMVDSQQPHIWFESCKNCYGRFYDAGEFRDFAEHTLAEFFEDLNAPERI
jgi:Zn-finger nucleic acid-binding protein